MQPSSAGGATHSWSDFLGLDEDDGRELIEGCLVEVDLPTRLHEWIVGVLYSYLFAWAMPRRAGVVLPSGFKVRISDRQGVMPDVQFFRTGRHVPEDALNEGAPDLVVEVISPTSGRYDRVEKLRYYAAIRAPEYWLVDPERHTLEQLVLAADGHYRVQQSLGGDETFAPASFPELSVPLSELWVLPEWFTGGEQ